MPLGARAWLGDTAGGALVAADGTVDWYLPGPLQGWPVCSALLDTLGGAIRVGPVRPGGSPARLPPAVAGHVPGTLISSLELDAGGGRRLRLVDFLPWAGPPTSVGSPPGRLVRIATALAGPVDVEVEYRPARRPNPPHLVVTAPDGVVADKVVVRAGMALEAFPLGRDDTVWRGVRRLETGERLVVTVDRVDDTAHPALTVDAALALAESTAAAWRWWSAPIVVGGPYGAAVTSALRAVRSLTGPGGAPAAAGTTSLGRRDGGERTSDDRYVRWRHVATAASLLGRVGLDDEAAAAEGWLRSAAESVPWPWATALGPDAAVPDPREELPMSGWRGSQPVVVRRSDPADRDLVGDVVRAVSASTGGDSRTGAPGGSLAGPLTGAWPALVAAADALAAGWGTPDGGVWGLGGPPRRLTATRVQAWSALDRMSRLARAANPLDLDAVGWQQAASSVLAALEWECLAPDGGLQLSPGPSDDADAALLRVVWTGPWPVHHPIVTRTVDRVLARLGDGPWVRRYPPELDDGVGGPDGADLTATLWAVRAEAILGRWEPAHERMEAVVALMGPAADGVLSEAVDPLSGGLAGNLPSTSAHLALAEAALALEAGPT